MRTSTVTIVSPGLMLAGTIILGATFGLMAPHMSVASLPAEGDGPVIDLAICIDVSGSMQKLLDATNVTLWEIINGLAEMDPAPRLRVAILSYGYASLSPESGGVTIEAPLTKDFDLVSERLSAVRIRGSEEYVARAIETAIQKLDWDESEEALRLIFVVGNEVVGQDPMVSIESIMDEADNRDIVVSTVFCERPNTRVAETWKNLARLGRGKFTAIGKFQATKTIDTPFDSQLAELSASLNETYIPIGKDGREKLESQALQDKNAFTLDPAAGSSRALAKTTPLYSCSWDLVDTVQRDPLSLDEIDESQFPDAIRAMSHEDRQDYIDSMILTRETIRRDIRRVAEERLEFLQARGRMAGASNLQAFDGAILQGIQDNMEQKGLSSPD